MTRKHFKAIATALADSIQDTDVRLTAARAMARELCRFNPRFDTERFITACMK